MRELFSCFGFYFQYLLSFVLANLRVNFFLRSPNLQFNFDLRQIVVSAMPNTCPASNNKGIMKFHVARIRIVNGIQFTQFPCPYLNH